MFHAFWPQSLSVHLDPKDAISWSQWVLFITIHFSYQIKYLEKMAWQWNDKIYWKLQRSFIFIIWNHLGLLSCREFSVWESYFLRWQKGSCNSLHTVSTLTLEVQKARAIPNKEEGKVREGEGRGGEGRGRKRRGRKRKERKGKGGR